MRSRDVNTSGNSEPVRVAATPGTQIKEKTNAYRKSKAANDWKELGRKTRELFPQLRP